MESNEPVYSVGSRTSPTRILVLIAIAYLLASFVINREPLSILLAMVLVVLLAYTWQTRYQLFLDALVIRHLWPRVRVLPLAQVRAVLVVRIPMGGEGLLIQRTEGRPVFIRPRDPVELHDQIDQLLGHETAEPGPEED